LDFYIPRLDPRVLWTLSLIAAFVGVWRGGWEGRVLGVMLAALTTMAVLFDLKSVVTNLLLDSAALAVCLAVTLRSRSYWTVWVTAAQVLMVVTGLLAIALGLDQWAHLSAQVAWSYVFSTALLVGSLRMRRPART
jgi:hypothetical protein